jgi:hypothetical protein
MVRKKPHKSIIVPQDGKKSVHFKLEDLDPNTTYIVRYLPAVDKYGKAIRVMTRNNYSNKTKIIATISLGNIAKVPDIMILKDSTTIDEFLKEFDFRISLAISGIGTVRLKGLPRYQEDYDMDKIKVDYDAGDSSQI